MIEILTLTDSLNQFEVLIHLPCPFPFCQKVSRIMNRRRCVQLLLETVNCLSAFLHHEFEQSALSTLSIIWSLLLRLNGSQRAEQLKASILVMCWAIMSAASNAQNNKHYWTLRNILFFVQEAQLNAEKILLALTVTLPDI